MPLFGSHLSIAGGLYKAVDAAAELGMDTVQIFTGSPQIWSVTAVNGATQDGSDQSHWKGKLLPDDEIRRFKEAIQRTGMRIPCSHDSYLINLASPDPAVWYKSIAAFVTELTRAESLGLSGVVMHPGSHVTATEEEGLAHVAEAFEEIHQRTKGFKVQTWIEATAGQGTNLGHRFEHLGYLLKRSKQPERLGICIDTCHIFAAGYPLKTKAEYEATMQQLDEQVGIEQIRAFHLNDSKKGLGSRVDRHEHIGAGELGLTPFGFLLNDPRFAKLPMYLETKKEKRDGEEMDAVNLRQLKQLIK